ncbi:MAG: CapA family protein [Peptococcaceae bacterium]|nr:CapA family protein [Peptococcaceae bacterium]
MEGLAEKTEEKKLNRKERVLRYVAHMKPMRGYICLLWIGLLFGVLALSGLAATLRTPTKVESSSLVSQLNSGYPPALRVAFTGDMMLGRSVQGASRFYGYDYLLANIKDYWEGFDIVMSNFENPLLDSGAKYVRAEKEILLSANKECLSAVKEAGYSILGLANNHMMDYGAEALLYTLESLEEKGIHYVGAGVNSDRAKEYYLQDINGLKVAIVAVTDIYTKGFAATYEDSGVFAVTSDSNYLEAIAAAKEAADVVIFFVHWGNEYTTILTKDQQRMGRNAIDAGADFVVGSHSHVIQPVEIYRGKVIFYSLGNIIMDQGWSTTKDSLLLGVCMDKEGNIIFEAVPLRIKSAAPEETRNPFYSKRIFRTLTKKLDSSYYTIENNRLYIFPAKLNLFPESDPDLLQ